MIDRWKAIYKEARNRIHNPRRDVADNINRSVAVVMSNFFPKTGLTPGNRLFGDESRFLEYLSRGIPYKISPEQSYIDSSQTRSAKEIVQLFQQCVVIPYNNWLENARSRDVKRAYLAAGYDAETQTGIILINGESPMLASARPGLDQSLLLGIILSGNDALSPRNTSVHMFTPTESPTWGGSASANIVTWQDTFACPVNRSANPKDVRDYFIEDARERIGDRFTSIFPQIEGPR